MLCPFCGHQESKVMDKRDFGGTTKRRRECLKCERRYNTQENVEKMQIRVIKKDGSRQEFDREKIRKGILRACEKRPISTEQIENMMNIIEEKIRKKGQDVSTAFIGEQVSKELKKVDSIAYIRFASVYREFTDVADFKKEIKELVK